MASAMGMGHEISQSPQPGRKNLDLILSPLSGLVLLGTLHPRLTPWATIYRRLRRLRATPKCPSV